MKWVRDQTGRFMQRPHYDPVELDQACETIISTFLRSRHASITYPISTNDLVLLLERETQDLDLFSDLISEGDDVEGVTEFFPNRKPRVRISQQISEDPRRENRFRTTLTHEFGHVKFHNFVWAFDAGVLPMQGKSSSKVMPARCNRDTILDAPSVDWMEWQAGYASGAFLMPIAPVGRLVRKVLVDPGPPSGPVPVDSPSGQALIREVQQGFQVSADAARVRLLKLRHLAD